MSTSGFDDDITKMGLDQYGFPVTAIANSLLLQVTQYGDEIKQLTKTWESWLHQYPFDSEVAGKLVSIYEDQLKNKEPISDGALRQRYERKRNLAQQRSARYRIENFLPNQQAKML